MCVCVWQSWDLDRLLLPADSYVGIFLSSQQPSLPQWACVRGKVCQCGEHPLTGTSAHLSSWNSPWSSDKCREVLFHARTFKSLSSIWYHFSTVKHNTNLFFFLLLLCIFLISSMFLGDVIFITAICQEIALCQLGFLSCWWCFTHPEVTSSTLREG